ncbi:hypothetical protein IT072_03705 [Leifsonia sp. ZF2019]|uniref:hypothetical protein n=1 Tax=Leifsonia sp. ZF2019 TaxID=2781978 RepID=UPI001CBF1481|nr:hypothetical protein [Leifsonia sp. ZF2019]UAJ80164.1 hypothetical protein IT072_03705 [Leifsonia sp. ZF2019]
MALPDANSSWPPKPWDQAYKVYSESEVWRVGDPDAIHDFYRGERPAATHRHNGELHEGGVAGWVSSKFWGRPVPPGQNRTRLHVPAPADVASMASANIFSNPPELRFSDKQSQATLDRLELIGNSDEAHATFNTMGELKSVFGASVLTTEWDTETADHVWLSAYGADVALPEFRKGKLVAVTLWTEYRVGSVYYRHLERHSIGRIEHALYAGSSDKVGQRVPLQDHPETEYLATLVNGDSAIETGLDRLTASYNVNLPSWAWRKKGQLASAGRSDFAQLYPLFDALDEAYSSWMRDLKLGAAKAVVPQAYLDTLGRGKGASFDIDRELFVGLATPGNPDGDKIEQVQFDIRVEEHEATTTELWRIIYRTAGLGTRSVDRDAGKQLTATGELLQDDDKEATRGKKILYDKRAIAEQLSVALELDGKLFPGKGGGRFDLPEVRFPDSAQVDPEKQARTIQYLSAASAISIWQSVKMFNPDWDDPTIQAEVDRILDEKRSSTALAPDPATFTGDPTQEEETDDPADA